MDVNYNQWLAEASAHGDNSSSYFIRAYTINLADYYIRLGYVSDGRGYDIAVGMPGIRITDQPMALQSITDDNLLLPHTPQGNVHDDSGGFAATATALIAGSVTAAIDDDVSSSSYAFGYAGVIINGIKIGTQDAMLDPIRQFDRYGVSLKHIGVKIDDGGYYRLKMTDGQAIMVRVPTLSKDLEQSTYSRFNNSIETFAAPIVSGSASDLRIKSIPPVIVNDEIEIDYFDQAIIRLRPRSPLWGDNSYNTRMYIDIPDRRWWFCGDSVRAADYRGLADDGLYLQYKYSMLSDPYGNTLRQDPYLKEEVEDISRDLYTYLLNLEHLIKTYPNQNVFSFKLHLSRMKNENAQFFLYIRTYVKSKINSLWRNAWTMDGGYFTQYYKLVYAVDKSLLDYDNHKMTMGQLILDITYDKKLNKGTIKRIVAGDENLRKRVPFGVGIAPVVPPELSELPGTRDPDSPQYGNYTTPNGSIMVWVPRFYFRVSDPRQLSYDRYHEASIDLKFMDTFKTVAQAMAQGYSVHRAFYDNGQLKDGFFIDKYPCSEKEGSVVSIPDAVPLIAGLTKRSGYSETTDEISITRVNGVSDITLADTLVAVKTRGSNFSIPSLFQYRALSMIALAQLQKEVDTYNCEWVIPGTEYSGPAGFTRSYTERGTPYDSHYPYGKGEVYFTDTKYTDLVQTGSATRTLKHGRTTGCGAHNGQANGVMDLSGNIMEVALGVTHQDGIMYVLKDEVKLASLTSGNKLPTDCWGPLGVANNYRRFDLASSTLLQATGGSKMGNSNTNLSGDYLGFHKELTGDGWLSNCLGGLHNPNKLPLHGDPLFQEATFAVSRTDYNCPTVKGLGEFSSIWGLVLTMSYNSSSSFTGFRTALYI